MSEQCLACHVSGHVQGVFFRGSAQAEAERLGIRGYARNLRDGRVRVLACGPEDDLAAFRNWLRQGPPAAQVEDVQCEPADEVPPDGFEVR